MEFRYDCSGRGDSDINRSSRVVKYRTVITTVAQSLRCLIVAKVRGEIWEIQILFGVICGIAKKLMKNVGNPRREIINCIRVLINIIAHKKDVFGCAKIRHV